jgi:hypothetical protein
MTRTLSKLAEGIAFTRPAGSGEQAQTAIIRRYDRLAGLYGLYTQPMEWAGLGRRRCQLLANASGNTLEVGIGTGRSLDYHRAHILWVPKLIRVMRPGHIRGSARPVGRPARPP